MRGELPHFDGVAVETGQDTMPTREVAAPDEVAPPLVVALVRLTCDLAGEPFQVALDRRPPLLEGLAVEKHREPPVQLP